MLKHWSSYGLGLIASLAFKKIFLPQLVPQDVGSSYFLYFVGPKKTNCYSKLFFDNWPQNLSTNRKIKAQYEINGLKTKKNNRRYTEIELSGDEPHWRLKCALIHCFAMCAKNHRIVP